MANALTIAGSDSVGGAGLQADLKAFEAVGVHGCSVVTCVTSQNTKGVASIFPVPIRHVVSQLKSVLEDVQLDAVKTGMLFTPDIVGAVARHIRDLDCPIVVDPVMAATTGSCLHRPGFVDALASKLLPICSLVTPNTREAARLSGTQVKDEGGVRMAAKKILDLGPRAVLIKGGHLKGSEAADYLFVGSRVLKLASPRVEGEVHGTGCTLASLIAAHLALGKKLEEAVRVSKKSMYKAILSRERVGLGVPCANPLALLRIEAGKVKMLEELEAAAEKLELILEPGLIPEVGINIGYAVLGALEPEEVAAFSGRICRVGERALRTGTPRFGASKHVARIVLAASSHDPEIRCAMNIKYTERNVAACRAARLAISSFDRAEEPEGVSSMTWGVHRAIARFGRVPDVIYDKGGVGKEPMIRILGRTPNDVLRKLERIIERRGPG